jgi:hypothetical protein
MARWGGCFLEPRKVEELLGGARSTLGVRPGAKDWEWSSARWYAGMRPVPSEMDSMVLEE